MKCEILLPHGHTTYTEQTKGLQTMAQTIWVRGSLKTHSNIAFQGQPEIRGNELHGKRFKF